MPAVFRYTWRLAAGKSARTLPVHAPSLENAFAPMSLFIRSGELGLIDQLPCHLNRPTQCTRMNGTASLGQVARWPWGHDGRPTLSSDAASSRVLDASRTRPRDNCRGQTRGGLDGKRSLSMERPRVLKKDTSAAYAPADRMGAQELSPSASRPHASPGCLCHLGHVPGRPSVAGAFCMCSLPWMSSEVPHREALCT